MKTLPKGLANSGALVIAKKLKTISGGKVLDVATESGDFINTLYFVQFAYALPNKLKNFTPYMRYEEAKMKQGDPYYSLLLPCGWHQLLWGYPLPQPGVA